MRRWQHRKKSGETARKAEVSAWLESVGNKLDDELADNEVERGLSVYNKTLAGPQASDRSGREADTSRPADERGDDIS